MTFNISPLQPLTFWRLNDPKPPPPPPPPPTTTTTTPPDPTATPRIPNPTHIAYSANPVHGSVRRKNKKKRKKGQNNNNNNSLISEPSSVTKGAACTHSLAGVRWKTREVFRATRRPGIISSHTPGVVVRVYQAGPRRKPIKKRLTVVQAGIGCKLGRE